MLDFHARTVAAGTYAQEGDAVAVVRIHVGLDLEHETGECRFGGLHHAHIGGARAAVRAPTPPARAAFTHAEVVDAGAEEHRGLLAAQKTPAGQTMRLHPRLTRFVAHGLHLARALLCELFDLRAFQHFDSWLAFASPGEKRSTSSFSK